MADAGSGPASGDPVTPASKAPVLGDAFKEQPSQASTDTQSSDLTGGSDLDPNSAEKRRLLALRNKAPVPIGVTSQPATGMLSSSPTMAPPAMRSSSPRNIPASPGRLAQASPRVTSPSSSLIFERNVQEDVVPASASPAIPAHIATENHIPPVLESAAAAITDDLDPDTVEIVTHPVHLPAASVMASDLGEMPLPPLQQSTSLSSSANADGPPQIPPPDLGSSPIMVPMQMTTSMISAGTPTATGDGGMTLSPPEDSISVLSGGPGASNYGSIDTNDIRRLSFISFADVVHAEQAVGGDATSIRDSIVVSPAPPADSPALGAVRSASPLRSPISPSLSASGSGAGSGKGHLNDPGSPANRARSGSLRDGSPQAHLGLGPIPGVHGSSPPGGNAVGELNVETMTDALRQTVSSDLSGVRSSIIVTDESDDKPSSQQGL